MRLLPLLLSLAAVYGTSLLASFPAAAQPAFYLSAADAAAKKDDLYRAGQRDIDAGRWTQAIDKFSQVARRGGAEADAALYWKAYAENKAGRPQQAVSTLRQLAGSHPKSAWRDDAKALEVEIRGASGKGADPAAGEDEELKLYALNGLLGSDPDRALPMLQKFLRGNHSPRLKEQALFVISQSDAPEARKTLHEVARGSAHPELQMKAIEYLGIAGSDENVRALDEIYRASARPEVKSAVLNAYLVANQSGRVFAVARDAKDPLRGQAISLLGAMSAEKELRQLYQSETSPGARMKVLEALGVARDVTTLAGIARQEQDPALRRKAIQGLGVAGGAKAAEALRSLYSASSDPSIRRAVLEALFVQNNARGLIEVFHAEKDREVRRQIVQYLSLMDSEEASKFLEKIYNN
ncbi:MAG TPA: HEAT repeat domain-containing protein [Thermoanaerobaculia bacterium]|jgi:HEAT repeat protein